jgi:hypothetical protein
MLLDLPAKLAILAKRQHWHLQLSQLPPVQWPSRLALML